jgi:hypothetical protein
MQNTIIEIIMYSHDTEFNENNINTKETYIEYYMIPLKILKKITGNKINELLTAINKETFLSEILPLKNKQDIQDEILKQATLINSGIGFYNSNESFIIINGNKTYFDKLNRLEGRLHSAAYIN